MGEEEELRVVEELFLFWVIHEPGDFMRERTEDGDEGDDDDGDDDDEGPAANVPPVPEEDVAMAVWMAEVNLLARSFELPFLVPPLAVALVTMDTEPMVAAAETAAFSAAQY